MDRTFVKMHGCGNDYIYFDCLQTPIEHPDALAIRLSDRHKGVGGDGVVLICPSEVADAKMRMFNIDGSEGKMCGNAIRCVGKYLFDSGRVARDTVRVETLSGVKELRLSIEDKKAVAARVDMGPAEWRPEKIPVALALPRVVDEPVTIGGTTVRVTCVSMGNPHCVVFASDVDTLALETLGPVVENAPLFPERVNTEFIQVLGPNELKMRVWERGSGETMACGTGACAAAVAAVENGHCQKDRPITVHLRGGDLIIEVTDDTVYMTGGAEVVFTGRVTV